MFGDSAPFLRGSLSNFFLTFSVGGSEVVDEFCLYFQKIWWELPSDTSGVSTIVDGWYIVRLLIYQNFCGILLVH